MTANTTPSIVSDDLLDDKPIWFPARPKIKWSKPTKFPPDKDIELWLKHNAPSHFSNSLTSGTPCITSAAELILQLQKHSW